VSVLDFQALLGSIHMCYDAPELMTQFEVVAAPVLTAEVVSPKGLQSLVLAEAAVAVDIFTLHHSLIIM